jgi:hypothetical protein
VAALLADPARRLEAYRMLFPPLESLFIWNAHLEADRPWRPGTQKFMFRLAAPDSRNLLLRGEHPPLPPIFNLYLRDGWMTVLFHPQTADQTGFGFSGYVDGMSPFGLYYGVEPGDLYVIFTLGQSIADGELEPAGDDGRILKPRDPQSALQKVWLDRETWLPRRALWRRPQGRWEVQYQEWDDYGAGGSIRLMPHILEIVGQPANVRLNITVRNYRFTPLSPNVLKVSPSYLKYEIYPLEELGKVLEDL